MYMCILQNIRLLYCTILYYTILYYTILYYFKKMYVCLFLQIGAPRAQQLITLSCK